MTQTIRNTSTARWCDLASRAATATAHSAQVEEVCRHHILNAKRLLKKGFAIAGAGNISDVGTAATQRKDADAIPEEAFRPSQDTQGFHTGRGGVGNEHRIKDEHAEAKPHPVAPVGLADKLKNKLLGVFKH